MNNLDDSWICFSLLTDFCQCVDFGCSRHKLIVMEM